MNPHRIRVRQQARKAVAGIASLTVAAGIVAGATPHVHAVPSKSLSERSSATTTPAPELAQPTFGGKRKVVLGKSVRGRNITATRLGNSRAPIKLLAIGQMHGNEKAGTGVIKQLRKHAKTIPTSTQIWVIPSIKPDGFRLNSRHNSRGVDLNRNFPANTWRKSKTSGKRPASEPETRHAMKFVKQLNPQGTIMFHQPWGIVMSKCDPINRPFSKKFSQLTGIPQDPAKCKSTPGIFTGSMGTWHRQHFGTQSSLWFLTVELSKNKKTPRQVTQSRKAILTIAKELSASAA